MAAADFSVKIKSWTPVAIWKWEVPDETCGICMADMDGCAPGVKFPGDECPPVFGRCGHAFHMPCLMKWLESRTDATAQICPLCRQPWEFVEFKSPSRREPAAAGEAAQAEGPADGAEDAADASDRGSSDAQSGGSSVMDFDLSDATH